MRLWPCKIDLSPPVWPSQGFWGFREKGYLFSGIWGEGSFIFRDLGRKHSFREQGAGEKGHFSFREQGAKTPPPCGASPVTVCY